ncbi:MULTISPECIES: nuclear transport factor 2 family protein [unclassified Microbacterium]|uniref:nuclear transport factor 2 family protein n=1 Tax=unclassified Microbacterium TaxID=2609290 RepID=UPI003653344D
MVYSMIVRKKVRDTFDQINAGNYAPMVEGLASPFEYVFHGVHALGGRRVTKEAMNRWWERTLALLPGARFDVQDVLVRGGPWNTRIAVRSRVTGPLPGGEVYENIVFQFMTLKWGKVTSVETVEDLQILERALKIVADAGNAEAAAAPIVG